MDKPPVIGEEPTSINRSLYAVIVVVLLVVFPLISSALSYFAAPAQSGEYSVLAQYVSLVFLGAYTVAISALAISISGDKASQFGIVKWDWKRDLLIPLGLGPAFYVASLVLTSLFMVGSVASQGVSASAAGILVVEPIYFPFAFLCLLASALGEEISMRAVLMTRLNFLLRRKWAGVVVSSLIFTSYHIYQGWVALPVVFILGIGFSLCFLQWKSLWQLTLIHAINNILGTAYAYFYFEVLGQSGGF